MVEQAKLRLRARRGMRELDLLLERFLARHAERLTEAERRSLERLLEYPDPDILAWVAAEAPAPDAELQRLIGLVRETARGFPAE